MNFCRLLWMSMGIQGLLILDKQRMDFIYGWLFWSSFLLGGENASPLVSNFDPFLKKKEKRKKKKIIGLPILTWFPWFTETARLNCFFVEFEHAGIWRQYLLTFYFFRWPLNWLPPVMLWTSLMLGHESWPWSSHDKIHSVPFYVSIALFNSSVCDQVSCCLLALIGVSFYNKSRIIFFFTTINVTCYNWCNNKSNSTSDFYVSDFTPNALCYFNMMWNSRVPSHLPSLPFSPFIFLCLSYIKRRKTLKLFRFNCEKEYI